jgi:hypothetical protein
MSGTAALLGAPLYAASGPRALWFAVGGVMAAATAWAALLSYQAGAWRYVAPADRAVSADPSPA